MSSVEKVIEQSLLYDYYGELLTAHQRKIYEAAVFEDLSLGEIAEETGISRQGVYDLLKRCDAKLEQYEASLHLLKKHERLRSLAESIDEEAEKLKSVTADKNTSGQVPGMMADESISDRVPGEAICEETSAEAPGETIAESASGQTPDGMTDESALQQSLDRLQQLVHQLLEEI